MLTAKIGENFINCYDGRHDREILKKWASKNIIICPVCQKSYEYCHGKIKSPYFRHKDKEECLYKYYEAETEEHIKGKIDLYEWVKSLEGVTGVILEGWIPETKQRPDIMFKYGEKQWVIEYQCTPISSEYIERHSLYQAAGINDIWICGMENYNVKTRRKLIEQECNFHYDSKSKEVVVYSDLVRKSFPFRYVNVYLDCKILLDNIFIKQDSNKLLIKTNVIKNFDELLDKDNKICEEQKRIDYEIKKRMEQKEIEKSLMLEKQNNLSKLVEKLNQIYDKHTFELIKHSFSKTIHIAFYINKFDLYKTAEFEIYKKSFYYRYGFMDSYNKYSEKNINFKNENELFDNIIKIVNIIKNDYTESRIIIKNYNKQRVREEKERELRISKTIQENKSFLADYHNYNILLIKNDGKKHDIRFKYLRDFEISSSYMKDVFINELKFLEKINVKEYVFMIPKRFIREYGMKRYLSNSPCDKKIILSYFKLFGFNNVEFI